MSYIYAEKAEIGNDICPWCGNEIDVCEQIEDGMPEGEEECECPWCAKTIGVTVDYIPTFTTHRPWDEVTA